MNAVVSVCLLACALGIIVYLLSRRETTRRSQYGPAGLSEFRTGLALDECFDRLTLAATPTSLPTSAAGRTTAAFCCT